MEASLCYIVRPYLQNKSDETCNLNRGDCPSFPACTCIAGNIEHSTEELWVTLSGYLHCCSAGLQLRPLSTRAQCQAAEKTSLNMCPVPGCREDPSQRTPSVSSGESPKDQLLVEADAGFQKEKGRLLSLPLVPPSFLPSLPSPFSVLSFSFLPS